MKFDRIYLDSADKRVYIDAYIRDDSSYPRPAMLVIPGGGYGTVCSDREGEPIALAFLAKDFNCFVLNYRVGSNDRYPSQLIDASRAILHIRENAAKYAIDPKRVYAVGFSAGGHLAGSLAILHKDVANELGIDPGVNRPDAAILAYPVVSASLYTHGGSFVNLTGKAFEDISVEERRRLSLEQNVSSDSAPLFIWHTAEDVVVPPLGSIMLATKYVERGIPVMLHLYPYGPHGVALGNKTTVGDNPEWIQPLAAGWVDAAVEWLATL